MSFNQLNDTIPSSLGNLQVLEVLRLTHNRLSGNIPTSFSNLKKLQKLNVRHNKLSGAVPSFLGSLNKLKRLNILNNLYNFDGIETLVQHNGIDTFRYYEQKKNTIHQNNNLLSVYAGGTLSNNTYKWYKDGALIATINGDSMYTPTTSGAYNVQASNSIATQLRLYSDTITVSSLNASKQNNIAAVRVGEKNNFSVYPNPAKTNGTIAFNATGNYTVKLTDINGTVLQIITGVAVNNKNMLRLDVSKYAAGVYFLTISNAQNEIQTLRLSKE